MTEKQLCGKCGHEIETIETDKEWSQYFGKTRLVHKGSGTNCLVDGCHCCKPEPQILCGHCHKPKSEHFHKFSIVPEYNGYFCSDTDLVKFAPEPEKPNPAPEVPKKHGKMITSVEVYDENYLKKVL